MSFDLGDSAPDADEEDEEKNGTQDEQTETAEEEINPRTTPAFEFNDTEQTPFYVRPSTRTHWDRIRRVEVERVFVDQEIDNVRKSEIHDAVLRLASEYPEEIARLVLEARGVDEEE